MLRRGTNALHLSENKGDARPNTLVYLYVENVDKIAKEFDVQIDDQPWAREVQLTDPDGNRLLRDEFSNAIDQARLNPIVESFPLRPLIGA